MNLDVNQGGVFLDRELAGGNKQPHERFFDPNDSTIYIQDSRCKCLHLISVLESNSILYTVIGKTLHPYNVENNRQTGKTLQGVTSSVTEILVPKIPPCHLHRDCRIFGGVF